MSSDQYIPARPPTPQAVIHRLPDEKLDRSERTPSKYIVLILGSTATAGKVQIASAVAKALDCPEHNGDSLHESTAKAATVGASRAAAAALSGGGGGGDDNARPPNEARYQRMWLAKLTRTGLLFPDESRPATEAFIGFGGGGGGASTSTSRRGSWSSVASVASSTSGAGAGGTAAGEEEEPSSPWPTTTTTTTTTTAATTAAVLAATGGSRSGQWYVNKNVLTTVTEAERKRRANPALMVLTHPPLEKWHRDVIRSAVGDYGIGVIFVPLYLEEEEGEDDEDDLPILRPLDPSTMTSFPMSFGAASSASKTTKGSGSLDREMKYLVDVDADVDSKILGITQGVRDIMGYGD